MTTEHLNTVLTFYKNYLHNLGYQPLEKAKNITFASKGAAYKHLLWMCEKAIEEQDTDKSMRWLGFIQGCFWQMENFTIEEMRTHSRSPK